ncbi:MAG: hypothetical protein HY071_04285 [Chloroflexi bacterium]|nr:hypothetical protein [Chloroflexota bacterium]
MDWPGLHEWREFFLGLLTAEAALIGLLFVVLTIHLRVLTAEGNKALRATAAAIFMAYLTGLIIAGLALVPQPLPAFGIESFVLITVLFVIGQRRIVHAGLQAAADTVGRREFATRSRIYTALAFPGLAGQAAMAFGYPAGIAVLAAVVMAYQVLALLDTWDLVFRAASA